MKDDRFRPDAAARRVMPSSGDGIKPPPNNLKWDLSRYPIEYDAAKASFEPTKPIAGVGRNSIPKSHRGEGVNYVD